MRQRGKLLSENPFNKEKRKTFIESRSAYKKICRKSEKCYRQKLTQRLMNGALENPRVFWKIIKEMNNWGTNKIDPADIIPLQTWEKHFKELLNEKNKSDKHVSASIETKTFDPILDGIITGKELREALLVTKSGKAVGPDQILTEYLKIFGQTFEPIMLKLNRKIFSQNLYPDIWTSNYLKPIFKKGIENDTNNFRGLAIGSPLGKLYSHYFLTAS